MEIIIGDIHGSLKQFLYPFYSKGLCSDIDMKENRIEFLNLDLKDTKLIFTGDIFYGQDDDCIIANTLAYLCLKYDNIEWLLGNRDLLVFAKILKPTIKINELAFSYKKSPFKRFEQINTELLKSALLSKRIKVITRMKNGMLVSHAAITQEGINELKEVLDSQSIVSVMNDEVVIETDMNDVYIPITNSFDCLEDLNDIFTKIENVPLFMTKLKIFWNKHIFNAIEECVIGHETFINEYPEEAIEKILKFGSWLTDEYCSMNVQCQDDRAKQFGLKTVNYKTIDIPTNIHHVDCNTTIYDLPCFFSFENGEWYFNGGDEELKFKIIRKDGVIWKVIDEAQDT